MSEKEYMYLWTLKSLSTPQKIIQVAHAASQIGEKYHSNTYATLCEANDEEHLKSISEYLDEHSIAHSIFWEPDINSFTAIATAPLKGKARLPLRKFSTMQE